MRFTVNGIWKVTGQPTTISVEATDADAAEDNAARRGMDVKSVEKAKTIMPQLGPSAEEMEYARYVISSRYSMGKILFGLAMAGLGIGATWYGYNIASSSPGSGHYTVYWGLVIFGLYTAFKGAAANSHNEHDH
ncbi:MAG TPA: hypothetical protein VGP94_06315 [Tepidisphaeraceae bacterium]|jgi:hypothetical protein|nr:hypothetical protein [Tepidisphaeraceae bacterium]